MKDPNDFSDLGAVPADDFSDLGSIPVDEKQDLLDRIKSSLKSGGKSISDATTGDFVNGLLESATDTSRAIGQGMTMGGADEIGGGLSAAAEALYNKFNPTDVDLREKGFNIEQPGLAELYRKNQQSIQKEFDDSSARSPYLSAAGNLAGGMVSGSAIGGALGIGGEATTGAKKLLDIAKNEGKLKALGTLGFRGGKTFLQASPIIATESALSSKKGGLTSIPEAKQLGEDVLTGAAYALPLTMGLQGATEVAAPMLKNAGSKITSIAEDSPLLRQMKVAFGYGEQGINPRSQKVQLESTLGKTNLSELDNVRTQELMQEIQDAQNKIGQSTKQTLIDATEAGKKVDIAPEVKDSLSQVMSLGDKYPELASNTKAKDIYAKLSQTGAEVSPIEARDLIDYMDAYIGKFKSATNKTPLEEGILSNLYNTRKQFSNTLQTQIPEYGAASQRYTNFMNLVPETIIAKGKPVDIKDQFFGSLNKGNEKLFDALKQLNQGATKEGSNSSSLRESFVQSMKGMKTFEQQEAQRLASGSIKESALKRPVSTIEEQIKKNADDAVARGSMDSLTPTSSIGSVGKNILGVGAETGRSAAIGGANLVGRLKAPVLENNPVAKLSKAIYSAPHETVNALAQRLKIAPGLEKYGHNLEKALTSPDTNRRNQVLFTIMQNPSARAFIGDKDEETEAPTNYIPQE